MSAIPTTYTHATKLGPDGRAALAGARLVWDGLPSDRTREALRDGWCSRGARTSQSVRGATMSALEARGLIDARDPARPWKIQRLTNLGLVVREAGTRTQEGRDHG